MGFKWNDIYTNDIGIISEPKTLPVFPEPKIITEDAPGRDGFYDFSTFNADRRVHYKPREWEYKCMFENRLQGDTEAKKNAVLRLLSSYSGYLIEDKCKNVRWQGMITNKLSLTQVAKTLHSFPIFIRTQPFAEGLEKTIITETITASGSITVQNAGTWYVKPDIYLTGNADGMRLGEINIPYSGSLSNRLITGLELAPGENILSAAGFTGDIRFEFTPLYVWEAI